MAIDPAAWLTMFEVLERTSMPHADIIRLTDEGLLTTRRAGQVALYRADDVDRLVATGHALVISPTEVRAPSAPPIRRSGRKVPRR